MGNDTYAQFFHQCPNCGYIYDTRFLLSDLEYNTELDIVFCPECGKPIETTEVENVYILN